MLPSVSIVSRSACRLGSSGFAVRPSARALGGFSAAVGFASFGLAAQFARSWAVRLRPCVAGVSSSGPGAWPGCRCRSFRHPFRLPAARVHRSPSSARLRLAGLLSQPAESGRGSPGLSLQVLGSWLGRRLRCGSRSHPGCRIAGGLDLRAGSGARGVVSVLLAVGGLPGFAWSRVWLSRGEMVVWGAWAANGAEMVWGGAGETGREV